MKGQRGVTLVEVLAAAVLLAVSVAALLPVLRDAHGVNAADDSGERVFALARAADRIMEGLEEEGVEALLGATQRVAWPGDPGRVVVVRAEARAREGRRWAWVVFEGDGVAVARWAPLGGGGR